MDMYGLSTPADGIGIDDFLDFSNDDIFANSSTSTSTTFVAAAADSNHHHFPCSSDNNSAANACFFDTPNTEYSPTDFTEDLCVPDDDIAQLEWLSNFVDDSFTEFPADSITGTIDVRSEVTPFKSHTRSKRFRSTKATWSTGHESAVTGSGNSKTNSNNSTGKQQNFALLTGRERSVESSTPRRCTHCASEKTPQWRTGPLGPKTLCNACGVRYKSGRLVPEYRPAASPTFVLTQHSNSHRKVLELRRQKELLHQQQQQQHQEMYGSHHFQVC